MTTLYAATAISPARAQGVSDEVINQISFNLDVVNDSNVARSDRARAALRGLVRHDSVVSPSVRVQLARPLFGASVRVDGSVGYDFYRRNTQLDRERISIGADVALPVGPCRLTLSPSYDRRQSELSEIAEVALPGIDSIRNVQDIQTYRADARCGWKYGLMPLAFVERRIGDNSNVLRKFSDYRQTHIGTGVGYENPVLGKFDLTAERTDNSYPNRDVGPLSLQSGYRLDEVRFAARRDLGAILVANASIAYSRLNPDNPANNTFESISWDVGATLRPTLQTQVRLGFSQSLQPSLGAEALFSRDRSYSLDATYAFTSRTSLEFGASRNERRYRGVTAVTGPALTFDRLTSANAAIAFTPSPRLKLRLEVGYEKRNANGTIYDFSGRTIGLKTQFTL